MSCDKYGPTYYALAFLIANVQLLKIAFSFLTGELSYDSFHILPFPARFSLDPFPTNARILARLCCL